MLQLPGMVLLRTGRRKQSVLCSFSVPLEERRIWSWFAKNHDLPFSPRVAHCFEHITACHQARTWNWEQRQGCLLIAGQFSFQKCSGKTPQSFSICANVAGQFWVKEKKSLGRYRSTFLNLISARWMSSSYCSEPGLKVRKTLEMSIFTMQVFPVVLRLQFPQYPSWHS